MRLPKGPFAKRSKKRTQVLVEKVLGDSAQLEVYQRPHGPKRPMVCLDEVCKQLTASAREPLAARPGQVERTDYEYVRHGQANLFMLFAPLEAWREVQVHKTRNASDYARVIRYLVDECFPNAAKVVLVQGPSVARTPRNNLSTHHASSLYQTFPSDEAARLVQKLEIHYTPVHGSWLNMRAGPEGAVLPKTAEIELSVLAKQCSAEHVTSIATLGTDTQVWASRRNDHNNTVNWRFTTDDARVKLKRLYPSVLPG